MRYLALLLLALAAPSYAQTAVPTGTARAAGMPLNDGGLPAGMVVVRVVRGGFSHNAAGETVTMIAGGTSRTAQTGPDGRAQFMHLQPGTQVQVAATVDGEQLASDAFPMPADSGVRVLLVGPGDGTADAVTVGPVTLPGPTPVQAEPVISTTAPVIGGEARAPAPREDGRTVLVVKTVLTCCTLFALGVFLRGRRRSVPAETREAEAGV